MSSKPFIMDLEPAERLGCVVVFNVNRYEVYYAEGHLMFACYNKADLKAMIAANEIENPMFDSKAQRKYLAC